MLDKSTNLWYNIYIVWGVANIKVRDGEHLLPFTMNWDVGNPKEFGQVEFESFSENKGFMVNQENNVPSLTKID